jgi:hypothetical protein
MIGVLVDGAWFLDAVVVDRGIVANGIFMLSF